MSAAAKTMGEILDELLNSLDGYIAEVDEVIAHATENRDALIDMRHRMGGYKALGEKSGCFLSLLH